MRFAILSDIHGNLIAFEAVLGDIRSQGHFDHIIVAGDLCWFGPRPGQVIDRILESGARALMGRDGVLPGNRGREERSGGGWHGLLVSHVGVR